LMFSREIDSFRRQGKLVKVAPDAAPGNQIRVLASDRWYLAGCSTQECILNWSILGIQSHYGTAALSAYAVLEKVWNGVCAAYSYTAFEEARGGWLQESERLKKTDPEKAKQLDKTAA